MKRINRTTGLWLVLSVILVGLAAPLAASAAAGSAYLPPRPPTPTPTPSPSPTPSSVPGTSRSWERPAGSSIELVTSLGESTTITQLWLAVQWEDAAGGWHDVDGWQGGFDYVSQGRGIKTWWVDPKDFASGPFRWVLSQGDHGSILGTSAPFKLPGAQGEVLIIRVDLP